MPWIDHKNIILLLLPTIARRFSYRFLWNPKKSLAIVSSFSIIITSLVCNRLSLSLSLSSLEFARPARETRSSPPPFPHFSRNFLLEYNSTRVALLNLESPFLEHCKHPISYLEIGFAIETERDPPLPTPILRGECEGKLRIPGDLGVDGSKNDGNELTFCQDARWSLSNRILWYIVTPRSFAIFILWRIKYIWTPWKVDFIGCLNMAVVIAFLQVSMKKLKFLFCSLTPFTIYTIFEI